jgi:hypothetical protein
VHSIATSPKGVFIAADQDVTLCTKASGCATADLTTIAAGLTGLVDMSVSGTKVYFGWNFNSDNADLGSCPDTGCSSDGPTHIEHLSNQEFGRVLTGPNDLYWTYGHGGYGPWSERCALPDCTTISEVRPRNSNDGEQAEPTTVVSVGAHYVFWATGALYSDTSKQLRACALGSSCPTPKEIGTSSNSVSALTYYDGKHYGASYGDNGDVIFIVDDTTPGNRTILVGDAHGISDVAVDASGIYWVNGTTGKVLRCTNVKDGCAAGAIETLATGQAGARRIRLEDKFVDWMMPTSVMRVAK